MCKGRYLLVLFLLDGLHYVGLLLRRFWPLGEKMAVATTWERMISVVEPQINAEGIRVYPFDPSFPIDVRFFTYASCENTRMNRHDYFEVVYISSGKTAFQIQDRCYEVQQ